MTTARRPRRSRLRTLSVALLGILAVIGVLVSTLAVWTRATVLDSETVGAAARTAIDEPAVSEAMATFATDQAVLAADLEDRVAGLLPDRLDRLAPSVASGAARLVHERLVTALRTEGVRDAIERAIVEAHRAALRLLQGGGLGGWVTVQEGTVTVDLLPLVRRGLVVLRDSGLLPDVDLPDRLAGTADEARAQLSAALDQELREDFGQLVVYRSGSLAEAQASLATAQRGLVLFKRAVVLIVVVTLVLFGLTLALALNRRRAALALGLGLVAAFVIARLLIRRLVDDLPRLVTDPGAREATRTVASNLSGGLLRICGLLVVAGLVVVAVGVLTGPSRGATALRRRTGAGTAGVRDLLATHSTVAALVCGALALVALEVLGLGWSGLFAAGLLTVGGLAIHLRGAAAEPVEEPEAPA